MLAEQLESGVHEKSHRWDNLSFKHHEIAAGRISQD